jgi:hypothetical protein
MSRKTLVLVATAGTVAFAPVTGCDQLPGNKKEQGTVIGGVGGAVAGAAVAGEGNRLLGALIGGALGAGGGYLIGARMDKVDDKDEEGAREAIKNAQSHPATADDARAAANADVNNDGFVTLDEVVAMDKAGFSNQEMVRRLESTGQIFELNDEQERYLTSQGVDRPVIVAMRDINRAEKDRLLGTNTEVISKPK